MPEGKKSIGLGSFGDELGLRCHCGHLLSLSAWLGIYLSRAQDGHHHQTHECTGAWLLVTPHLLYVEIWIICQGAALFVKVSVLQREADRAPLRVNCKRLVIWSTVWTRPGRRRLSSAGVTVQADPPWRLDSTRVKGWLGALLCRGEDDGLCDSIPWYLPWMDFFSSLLYFSWMLKPFGKRENGIFFC